MRRFVVARRLTSPHSTNSGSGCAGDVETVAGRAGPGGTRAMQRRAIQRAGERLEWGLGVYAGGLQCGLHRLLAHRVGQHGMDGKQLQQFADMGFFTGMHEHNGLRLRRKAL